MLRIAGTAIGRQAANTIRRFTESESAKRTLKIFDVNLRQSYYSQEILAESMRLADIVKLNNDELPKIMSLSTIPHKDELSSAQQLIEEYELELVSITRGGRGSLLVSEKCERTSRLQSAASRIRWVPETLSPPDWFMNICMAPRSIS